MWILDKFEKNQQIWLTIFQTSEVINFFSDFQIAARLQPQPGAPGGDLLTQGLKRPYEDNSGEYFAGQLWLTIMPNDKIAQLVIHTAVGTDHSTNPDNHCCALRFLLYQS